MYVDEHSHTLSLSNFSHFSNNLQGFASDIVITSFHITAASNTTEDKPSRDFTPGPVTTDFRYTKTEPEEPAQLLTEHCFFCLSSSLYCPTPPVLSGLVKCRNLPISFQSTIQREESLIHNLKKKYWKKKLRWAKIIYRESEERREKEKPKERKEGQIEEGWINAGAWSLFFFFSLPSLFFQFFFFSPALKWFTVERKGLFPVLSWTPHQLPVRKARRKHPEQRAHMDTNTHTITHTGRPWLVDSSLPEKLGQALQCPAPRCVEI